MLTLLNPHRFAPSTFPTYHETLNQAFPSDATSFSVDLPSTVNPGDLLWLHFTVLNSGTITGPGGSWADLRTPTSVNIFSGKVAVGNEGSTSVSITKTGSATTAVAQLIRISNWSGSLADIESQTSSSLMNSSTVNPPGLSPSWGVGKTLWITTMWAQFQNRTVTSYPSNTENQNQKSDESTGGRCQVASATRLFEAASWSPDSFGLSGPQEFAAGYTFAIKAAA